LANVPDLAELMTGLSFVPDSRVTAEEWRALEGDLGLRFPPDYRDAVLRYELMETEVWGTCFAPPFTRPGGVAPALRLAFDPAGSPFADLYRMQSLVPVGVDFAEFYFVMAVEQVGVENAVAQRPFGSVWLFDAETGEPDFAFISSSFSQALRAALYAAEAYYRERGRPRIGPLAEERRQQLVADLEEMDPAISGHSYWRDWVAHMR
jgi:hypothetical protein